MPFTLAHPAAALPLRKLLGRAAVPTGLAVGSITPDLPYFVPFGAWGAESHSAVGLLLYCLPVGICVWFLYRLLLEPFVLTLVPDAVTFRLSPRLKPQVGLTELGAVAVSVIVGAASHLLWDSFTHRNGLVVQAMPALRYHVGIVAGYSPSVFTLLQHLSTLGGLSLLCVWGVQWLVSTEPQHERRGPKLTTPSRVGVIVVVLVTSVIAAASVLWSHLGAGESTFQVFQKYLGRAIFSAGSAFLVVVIAGAVVWRVRRLGLGES